MTIAGLSFLCFACVCRSADLQNFLAFEEGFDRLLCILRSEGGGGSALGGSVTSLDCLVLLRHVVHGNGVTSKLFLTMADLTVLPALLTIDPHAHLTKDTPTPQVTRTHHHRARASVWRA